MWTKTPILLFKLSFLRFPSCGMQIVYALQYWVKGCRADIWQFLTVKKEGFDFNILHSQDLKYKVHFNIYLLGRNYFHQDCKTWVPQCGNPSSTKFKATVSLSSAVEKCADPAFCIVKFCLTEALTSEKWLRPSVRYYKSFLCFRAVWPKSNSR